MRTGGRTGGGVFSRSKNNEMLTSRDSRDSRDTVILFLTAHWLLSAFIFTAFSAVRHLLSFTAIFGRLCLFFFFLRKGVTFRYIFFAIIFLFLLYCCAVWYLLFYENIETFFFWNFLKMFQWVCLSDCFRFFAVNFILGFFFWNGCYDDLESLRVLKNSAVALFG